MRIFLRKKQRIFFLLFGMIFLRGNQLSAQCALSYTLTTITGDVTLDDFADLSGGVTVNAAMVDITGGAGCIWDLYAENATITTVNQYTTQGAVLALANINVRAVNDCSTPDRNYGCCSPELPPRISGTLAAAFAAGTPNYIVGTAAVDGALFQNVGACAPLTQINGTGTPAGNPTTHKFRIDVQVVPGVVGIVRPGFYRLQIDFRNPEEGFAAPPALSYFLNIDIQPVLQLKMTTASQIDFTFSDIKQYNAGIVKYGLTILEVNSSIDWDLMAIGTSTSNEAAIAAVWDNPAEYSTGGNSSDQIPLRVLELHQIPANPSGSGAAIDYSPSFSNPPSGNNYIEVARSPYNLLANFVAPSVGAKTIAGNWLTATGSPANAMALGSYITIDPVAPLWNRPDFRYIIDYRLTPELPADFGGLMPAGAYARPGTYTMEVKYILSEDQ